MEIQSVYLFGDANLITLPAGQHSYVAQVGRKWVKLVDWCSLEVYRVERKAYDKAKPKATGFKNSRIARTMKARLQYLDHQTQFIKSILKALKNREGK